MESVGGRILVVDTDASIVRKPVFDLHVFIDLNEALMPSNTPLSGVK